jgi:hypothetical protein
MLFKKSETVGELDFPNLPKGKIQNKKKSQSYHEMMMLNSDPNSYQSFDQWMMKMGTFNPQGFSFAFFFFFLGILAQ